MKYTYSNGYYPTRTITLTRPAPEWINQDCPDLIDENGKTLIEFRLFDRYIYSNNEKEINMALKFIDDSDRSFCKKYKNFTYTKGSMIKDIKII